MRTSKEISIDLFIKGCIRQGMHTRREIIERAEETGENGSEVKDFLLEGKSRAYEALGETEDCISCGSDKLYDSENEEYYCAFCES